MKPITRDMFLLTGIIAILFVCTWYWGENESNRNSSGFIGGGIATFIAFSIFIYLTTAVFLKFGSIYLIHRNGAVANSPALNLTTKFLIVFMVPLVIMMCIAAYVFGGGIKSGDPTALDAGAAASFLVGTIVLVLLLYLWRPIYSGKIAG